MSIEELPQPAGLPETVKTKPRSPGLSAQGQDSKTDQVAGPPIAAVGASVDPTRSFPAKPTHVAPIPKLFQNVDPGTIQQSLLDGVTSLPTPQQAAPASGTTGAVETDQDEYALAQAHGHVDRILKAAGLAPLYTDDNRFEIHGHLVIVDAKRNRIIIPHINEDSQDIPLIIQELKKRADAPTDEHDMLLQANKMMIDKLEAKSARTLPEKEERRANLIADTIGEEFLRLLVGEGGGTLPPNPQQYLQTLREREVAQPAVGQAGKASSPSPAIPAPTTTYLEWTEDQRKTITGILDPMYRQKIREEVKKDEAQKAVHATRGAGMARPNRGAPPDNDAIQRMAERDKYIVFYDSTTTPWTECFGNFYEGDGVDVDGHHYKTAEGSFQAQRFLDPAVREQFKNTTGKESFDLSQRLKGQPKVEQDPDWIDGKKNVTAMQKVLGAKFKEGTSLAATLQATGNAHLVEHNSKKGRDAFWSDDFDGAGRNMLGKLLMQRRAELRGEKVDDYESFGDHRGAINYGKKIQTEPPPPPAKAT